GKPALRHDVVRASVEEAVLPLLDAIPSESQVLVTAPDLSPRELVRLQAAVNGAIARHGLALRAASTRRGEEATARRNMEAAARPCGVKAGGATLSCGVETATFTERQLQHVQLMEPPAEFRDRWATEGRPAAADDNVVLLFGENAEQIRQAIERRGGGKEL